MSVLSPADLVTLSIFNTSQDNWIVNAATYIYLGRFAWKKPVISKNLEFDVDSEPLAVDLAFSVGHLFRNCFVYFFYCVA